MILIDRLVFDVQRAIFWLYSGRYLRMKSSFSSKDNKQIYMYLFESFFSIIDKKKIVYKNNLALRERKTLKIIMHVMTWKIIWSAYR